MVIEKMMGVTDVAPNMSHEHIINHSMVQYGRDEILGYLRRIEDGTIDIQAMLKQTQEVNRGQIRRKNS